MPASSVLNDNKVCEYLLDESDIFASLLQAFLDLIAGEYGGCDTHSLTCQVYVQ